MTQQLFTVYSNKDDKVVASFVKKLDAKAKRDELNGGKWDDTKSYNFNVSRGKDHHHGASGLIPQTKKTLTVRKNKKVGAVT